MKKRRVKRYDAGGTTEAVEMPDITEEAESERRSRNLLGEQGRIIGEAMAPRRSIEKYIRQGERTPSESPRQNFGEAFSAARRSGAKSFEFGGKRYTTEMASEKKRVRSTAPTADESAAETARLARQSKMTESSRDKEGAPGYAAPAALAGAGAAAALAKMAMGRGEKKESLADRVKAREAGKSQSGSTVGKMPGSSLSDPYSMQLGSDLDVKRTLRGNKRMGMDSRDTEFKKGGKIKKMASGGKSSASSRADGIAQRGKTRGRMC